MAEASAISSKLVEKSLDTPVETKSETMAGITKENVASAAAQAPASEAEDTPIKEKRPATMEQKESPQEESKQTDEKLGLVPGSKESNDPPNAAEKQQEEKKEDEVKEEASAEKEKAQSKAEAKEEASKEPQAVNTVKQEAPASAPHTNDRGRPGPASPRHHQQQQHHHARLQPPSKSHALTEIVQSLFGPSVGPCRGDFSCQHNHVRGRLYASTEAVLFYSNIFGFEKKINLKYEDVLQMSLYRQTSIQVSVQDERSHKGDETFINNETNASQYVFKGFSDRSQTLQLLIELWRQSEGVESNVEVSRTASNGTVTTQEPSVLSPARSLSPSSGHHEANESIPRRSNTDGAPPSILKTPSKLTPPTPRGSPTGSSGPFLPDLPSSATRKRSKSVPNLHRRRSTKERSDSEGAAGKSAGTKAAPIVVEDDGYDWNATPNKSDVVEWEATKQTVDPCVKEVGIGPTVLSCSLGTFYKLFLANDAKYSIDNYQRGEDVKDLDVNLTPWEQQEPNTLVRTIDFKHPCGSFGVGPSHAPTKKSQRLRRFPGCGICITNSTTVEGLPGADCFVVEDHWVIEAVRQDNGNPQVKFSTRFGANFHKRTFLKSIIQKNIKAGNKEWYVGYRKMVQSALKDNLHLEGAVEEAPSTAAPVEKEEVIISKEEADNDLFQHLLLDGRMVLLVLMVSQVLLLLFLFFVANEMRSSRRVTEGLLQEIKLLRLEHGQVLSVLLDGQKQEEL